MIQRILKKDMRRRKSINFILFLFITLASIFLSSSMNNILVVVSAVDYYMDYANIPAVSFSVNGTDEKEEIEEWLQEDAPGIKDYGRSGMVELVEKNISIHRNGEKSEFLLNGLTMYLSKFETEYCKMFDLKGQEFTLKLGEIGVAKGMAERNNLKPGDSIIIRMGDIEKTFILKEVTKDAAFSSDMVGMSRMAVCKEDYQVFAGHEKAELIEMYNVDADNEDAFSQAIQSQGFLNLQTVITKSTYRLTYSFDMIMAALLILIALLGLAANVPVSQMMVAGVSENMVMKEVGVNFWINILCTCLIIAVVLMFCYGCTRKLNQVSAIAAIRGGQTGERYKRRAGLRLHRKKWMSAAVFLGLNDMLSHIRRYLVLMITFCLSFL